MAVNVAYGFGFLLLVRSRAMFDRSAGDDYTPMASRKPATLMGPFDHGSSREMARR